jgi:hypothetical protein
MVDEEHVQRPLGHDAPAWQNAALGESSFPLPPDVRSGGTRRVRSNIPDYPLFGVKNAHPRIRPLTGFRAALGGMSLALLSKGRKS